jgi:CHAT domain-containing protein/Flp pilus assembly protein TadD
MDYLVFETTPLQTLIALLLLFPLACFAQSGTIANQLVEADDARSASKWDLAMDAYQRARAAAQSAGDAKSEAAALAGMAETEFGRSHDDLALKWANESLEIAEHLGDPRAILAALRTVGYVQYRRGQLRESKQTAERGLALQEEIGDRNGIAVGLNNLGNAWRNLGDKLVAIDYLSRAEAEFAALGNGRSRAVVLNNIGLSYSDLGDYERGLEFSHKGLALSEAVKDDVHIGTTMNAIAVTEMYRGNYRESLRIYQKALEADRRSGYDWAVAEVTNNIGMVYHAQQNHEQAIAYFQQTMGLNRAVGNKSLDAEAHKNLGVEILALNRPAEAVLQFRQSIKLSVESASRSLESEAHRGLGAALSRLNRVAEAEAELQKAAEIQREIRDFPNLAQTYAELSRLRLKRGRVEEALAQARESIQLLSAIDRPETLWQAQLAVGRALQRLGRNDEAAQEFEVSMTTIESLRTRVAGPPTALPIYFADKLEPYQERVALALVAGKTDDALRFAEQSKSRALDDILRSGRTDLDKSLTPAERQAERRLQNRMAACNIQISNQPEDAHLKSERDRARRELEALQSDLYAAHPEIAFQRGESQPMSASEITQLAADTGAVILDYFVTPRNAYVFVIRRGVSTRVVSLGAVQSVLSAKAAEFHRQLAAHDLNYAASAQELYRLLLAPVARDLAGRQSAVILPDGPLWDVAFHALQPSPGHFLIEQTTISYAPSLSVLRETMRLARDRRTSPAGRELLALGNPAGQEPLPEAERQVREIEKLYGPEKSRILTGEAASQSRLKAEAGNYRVLHLASHAVLDGANPMYSYALLARSGSDAGMLEARELMQFNLKAELLVLSACETARGRAPGGEGINGMLWAAFVAGAPTTLASLWRVESVSTSDLMIGFHRNWLEGRRSKDPGAKAASLRKAALALIAGGKYSHPFYWAGFILIGSPV